MPSCRSIFFGLLIAGSASLVGCGLDAERVDPSALRAPLPEQGLAVIERGDELALTLADPLWTEAAPTSIMHAYGGATLLGNGNVLVSGYWNGGGSSSAVAELYDEQGVWTSTGASMITPRGAHTSTLLGNGKVLVTGGIDGIPTLSSAELYDPVLDTWSAAASMSESRALHSATLLSNGKVLVAGGFVYQGGIRNTAEIYDPQSNTWSPAGTMAQARSRHTATLLPNGNVLVAGGLGMGYTSAAEIYDPQANTWSGISAMSVARGMHTATPLGDGRILMAGGWDGWNALVSAELYNPFANTWTSVGNMAFPRHFYTATLLGNGSVLVVGGSFAGASAELYSPETSAWTSAGSFTIGRSFHTATRLTNGNVMVTGGFSGTSVMLYSPIPLGGGCAAASECASGYCTAGRCCDTPCDGACETCLAAEGASQDGTCGPKTSGAACDDNNPCTQTDTCQAGVCAGGDPKTCGPSDACHDAGICDPATGMCSNPQRADGSPCSDADLCTQDDVCLSGVCQSGSLFACPAQDQCHDAGACDPMTGVCSNPSKVDGASCDDGNPCTTSSACQAGACVGVSAVACPADACNDGYCEPADGQCKTTPKANGAACNDGDACTLIDVCQGGSCAGTTPVVCAAIDQCHDAGACDAMTGLCSNPSKPAGVACNDGDACTQVSACDGMGACVGASPVSCATPNLCEDAGVCDPVIGCPAPSPKPMGSACEDGNACTSKDACDGAGACEPGAPKVCAAQSQCHNPGTCDPQTGVCDNPIKVAGALCDDGDPCTEKDACDDKGACKGGSPKVCEGPEPCANYGACDPQAGCPAPVPKAENDPCTDPNDLCTEPGICKGGACVGGAPKVCPSDQCKDGYCDPAEGCKTKAKADGTSCNDGDKCTVSDVCAGGSCEGSSSCAPLGVCDEAACDPATGVCSHTPKQGCSLQDGGAGEGGPPPTVPGTVTLCSSDDQCATGHCSDGVCCDEACVQTCFSCILPGLIGTCAASPPGVDYRDDCYPGRDCIETCDGSGTCVGAGSNTQCAPPECADEVHLVGPATCSMAGADCPLDSRVPWSCAPYRCIDALRACGTKCDSIAQCAPGFVCDPNNDCVAPPKEDLEQGSGCAIRRGGAGSSSGLWLAGLMGALVVAGRRRRRGGGLPG